MYYHSTYLYCRNFELRMGTLSLTPRPVLVDYLDHSLTTARGLCHSLLDLCSGTASTTLRPQLEDFIARSSTYARGLPRPLSDHGSGTLRLDYMRLSTRIQLGFFSHLDLATRLIPRLPASSGTTSVRCTCRCISYCLYDDWVLNLTGNSFRP